MTDDVRTPAERALANPDFTGQIISDSDLARERQKASRDALKMNRRAKVDADAAHAQNVWIESARAAGIDRMGRLSEATTTDGIARAADAVVLNSIAMILTGDPQFVPQHGKEAVDMAKAMSAIARDYRARAMLEAAALQVGGLPESPETMSKIAELTAKLQARLEGR